PNQPTAAAMKEASEAIGLQFAHLPVSGAMVDPQTVGQFADLLNKGERIMAYCGAGPRAVLLTSLAEIVNGASTQAVMTQALEAGFDLRPAAGLLEAYAAARDKGED
ncbi:MAG: sulfur transferase domain-containing protein, partial [Pseudomonadota bacterium]